MRYQVVVLDSEIGTAMTIENLLWKRSPMGVDHGSYTNFKIYMGYTTLDALGTNFEDNYAPSSKTLVFSRSTYTLSSLDPNQWFTTALDTPFFYNGSNNLLIDIEWTATPDSQSVYVYNWTGADGRSVFCSPDGQQTGVLDSTVPHWILGGTNDLENETFASIKHIFD
jgi:hypothetical protein